MNLGIIGCGFIAAKHIQAFTKDETFLLKAVSDIIPEKMKQLIDQYNLNTGRESSEISTYESYQSLLEDTNVDVVVITTLSGLHGQIAIEALKQGKHVIVEKPMALSISEARKMIQLAKENKRQLAVCHQKRFYPHLQYVREAIQNGGLGTILFANVSLFYNRENAYYESAKWRGSWQMDGGVLLNQAIHNIDLVLWMIGTAQSVIGKINRYMRPIEAEDSACMLVQTTRGSMIEIEATVCANRSSTFERLELLGTKGSLILKGKYFENIDAWQVSETKTPSLVSIDPFLELYRDFHHAIRTNREPFVNGEEGIKALEAILAAYRSASIDSQVRLPLQNFSTQDMKLFRFPLHQV